MRFAKLLLAALWLVAAGCGDDSSATGGSGGTAGAGGSGGIDAPMVDAPGGTGGTGGMAGTDGGFNRTDAALSDAGSYKTPITPNSVPCQANGSPTTCTTPGQECCGVLTDAGSANVMCTAPAQCPAGAVLSLACDGPEDCPGNQLCCGERAAGGLGFSSSCQAGATCPAMARPMCHDHTQCPSTMTSCCEVRIGTGAAFTGRCYAAGMEPSNTACDTP